VEYRAGQATLDATSSVDHQTAGEPGRNYSDASSQYATALIDSAHKVG
jgi:hypothetical protein